MGAKQVSEGRCSGNAWWGARPGPPANTAWSLRERDLMSTQPLGLPLGGLESRAAGPALPSVLSPGSHKGPLIPGAGLAV